MAIEVGQAAPEFTLKNQDGDEVSLADFRGTKSVALVFFPFAFTGVCEGELCQIRDDIAEFDAAGVQVLALSCDSRFVQKVWADQKAWTFPVLADNWPHGAVAQAYGVFNAEVGCAVRTTFLIGVDGTVVDTFGTDGLGTAREKDRYTAALASL